MENREITIDHFTFFRSFYEAARYMPEDERLSFYDAILEFAFEGVDPEFEPGTARYSMFTVIRPILLKSIENQINGKKGGRPRKP